MRFKPARNTLKIVSFAPVAQRLERGTHNPLVAGSNPAGSTFLFPMKQTETPENKTAAFFELLKVIEERDRKRREDEKLKSLSKKGLRPWWLDAAQ